ncbi:MAG TPA: hypothetical protein VE999_07985 [Gemmataceae bacterium]|nr:hypothetical protein [Gemmataceae bacterium]
MTAPVTLLPASVRVTTPVSVNRVDTDSLERNLVGGSRAGSHASSARAGRSRQCQSKWADSTRLVHQNGAACSAVSGFQRSPQLSRQNLLSDQNVTVMFYSCGCGRGLRRDDGGASGVVSDLPDERGLPIPVKPSMKKYSYLQNFCFAAECRPFRSDQRGVRVVTNVERNCGGREDAVRRAAWPRTAKSCGPGAPMLRQALAKLQRLRERDGGKRWFTEEITYKP